MSMMALRNYPCFHTCHSKTPSILIYIILYIYILLPIQKSHEVKPSPTPKKMLFIRTQIWMNFLFRADSWGSDMAGLRFHVSRSTHDSSLLLTWWIPHPGWVNLWLACLDMVVLFWRTWSHHSGDSMGAVGCGAWWDADPWHGIQIEGRDLILYQWGRKLRLYIDMLHVVKCRLMVSHLHQRCGSVYWCLCQCCKAGCSQSVPDCLLHCCSAVVLFSVCWAGVSGSWFGSCGSMFGSSPSNRKNAKQAEKVSQRDQFYLMPCHFVSSTPW